VRWTVAGALDEQAAKRARQSGEFLLSPDDKRCELNSSVAEFANSSNECAFKLVVRV
jgi:hypothetical protein